MGNIRRNAVTGFKQEDIANPSLALTKVVYSSLRCSSAVSLRRTLAMVFFSSESQPYPSWDCNSTKPPSSILTFFSLTHHHVLASLFLHSM
ncbi:hypothetical protein RJT34_29151 [Clitoria ternatea]|uniref:Uncharacterized protein n=1 Tax=Clitoria ternatea TaxID=43366 RepID=A0AAN9IAR8_CLITE